MILPIAQGEVEGLVPRIYVLNFESAMMRRNSVIHKSSYNECRVCDFIDT